MLNESEKRMLSSKLPTHGEKLLNPFMAADAIKVLTVHDRLYKAKYQELEKHNLYIEQLNRYFLVADRIKKSGIPIEKLREFVEFANNHEKEKVAHDMMGMASVMAIKEVSERCPDCGQPLTLRNVTAPKGPKNIFGWKSSQFCDCGYETYSVEPFEQRAMELHEKAKPVRIKNFVLIKQTLAPAGLRTKSMICPECGQPMALQPVNIPKGRENVKGYRSVRRCYNCGYEKFSGLPFEKQQKQLRREVRNGNFV